MQLTTDGHRPYLEAVWNAFHAEIDYAILEKIYRNPPTGAQTRYGPGVCCGAKKKKITGNPKRDQVSTSYVERQNLYQQFSHRCYVRLFRVRWAGFITLKDLFGHIFPSGSSPSFPDPSSELHLNPAIIV